MQSGKKSPGTRFSATDLFTVGFGLFLGLCLWKFGNPVVLDHKIVTPASVADFWTDAWPTHWAGWILLPLALIGAVLIGQGKVAWPRSPWYWPWLWRLPLIWLGWQFISAVSTVDADLTRAALWQFAGCVACYFLGVFLFAGRRAQILVLAGVLLVFTFCLMKAADQWLYEFPMNHEMLVEGERTGWTNLPPEMVSGMKDENIIIHTNGLDVANPVILDKFAKRRVNGTLVYPNALAGAILLLWPVALALVFASTKSLKPVIRFAAIGMVLALGGASFFWTGSKLGWLLGIGVGGMFLLRLPWPKERKWAAVAVIMVLGLGMFAVRFHHYFAAGATSVGARFDYWHAAVRTTADHPGLGTGPGTFQRPYAVIKSPEAEMARLTHNDYLEQFSDSGIIGGLTYFAWIAVVWVVIGKRVWPARNIITFAIFAGSLTWFLQGFGEFSLYIPALAWIAFTLMGSLVGGEIIGFDKKTPG